MPFKKPDARFKSWSYSRYSDWRSCPLMAKCKHLDKSLPKEPPSDAMARGTNIHTMAEEFIKGKLAKLPEELKLFADEFKKLRALYKKKTSGMIVEDNWALTKDWTETQWDDWVGCWVRIKLDCAHYLAPTVMMVTDWKTGKPNQYKVTEYMEQLELYAVAALLLHDHLEEVHCRLAFTDTGDVYPFEEDGGALVVKRKDLPKLRKSWDKRVDPMFKDEKFVPKPGKQCNWCFYGQAGKAKGGPGICKF